jgi:beta-glucosidase
LQCNESFIVNHCYEIQDEGFSHLRDLVVGKAERSFAVSDPIKVLRIALGALGYVAATILFVGGCGSGYSTPVTYTVGGTVSGLTGSGLVLQNNGSNNLTVLDGAFAFSNALASGTAYSVTVFVQPANPSQTCVVMSGSGTLGGNVTNISVTCSTNSYTVGGVVTNLVGSGLALQDNSGDSLTINANGTFTFPTALISGNSYSVTVSVQPSFQTCAVLNSSGTTTSANVTNVSVNCGPPSSAASPDLRADYLVLQMTLDEKLQLVHGGASSTWWTQTQPRGGAGWVPGIPRLGIPDLYLADGNVGVEDAVGEAIALPSSIASAASWDLNEAAKYGEVIGKELRDYGINVNLGGNINLTGREPRDGRTFQTKGEDPLLAGKVTAAHLKAIQSQYVIAGIKHFGLNDQETGRFTANVLIDDRSARESDLLAFEIGVKDSNVQSVMCSYNLVNGTWACENPYLLNTVLKGSWGFPGFVMSDWDGPHSTVKAAVNGLDQEQPDSNYFGNLKQAMQNGAVSQSRLNDMVHRILRAMFAVGIFDHPAIIQPIDVAGDAAIAQEMEEQGAVLLKNTGVLPLNTSVPSIAVIGSHADIGVLSGGADQVIPVGGAALLEGYPAVPGWAQVVWDPSSPLKAIRAITPGASVQFNDGTISSSAAALAASSSVAIVFVSQWESEGMDVPSLNFTDVIHATPIDQDSLVSAVAAANPHTIVVMENGGAKVMPWLASVSAVLEAWYPGQRGGEAIANLLFGSVNPSGKLPITFPASVSQLPRPIIATPPDATTPFPVDYNIDGFNVGYKWYDSQNLTPLFPFGYGLSYTTFSITNPQLMATTFGSNLGLQVTFNVQNTGARSGAEVAQVYLGLPANTAEAKRLVGWQKVPLTAGQQQSVTIQIPASDSSHPFEYWDPSAQAWTIASGTFTVYLGNSSRNLTTVGTFQVP